MKSATLLRTARGLSLFFCLAHTIGTVWDFYFGLSLSLNLPILSALLWMPGILVCTQPARDPSPECWPSGMRARA